MGQTMNNRIKEFAKKAEVYSIMWIGDEKQDAWEEKFAELIIRECAEIAKTAEPWRSDDLILKHFGVK